MLQSFPDSLLICTTFFFFFLHTHLSLYLRVHACVCMCVYILAMGLDPSELRHCFASCWAWEKDGTPFHSCLGRGPGCWGPPYPLYTHPQFPLVRLPPPPSSLHPIQAPAYLLSKAGPPSQRFINTSHYSSPSLHRDSKEISTLLVRPEAPQPFGPHKCKFRLSNLPVLIFVLKRCVHTCKKTISPMSLQF